MNDKDKELAAPAVSGTLAVRSMDDLARMANMLATSGYFKDARDAAQAGVKILAGLEMGFGAFASMTGIFLIDGKPSVGANLLAQAVKRSGRYNYRVLEHSDEECRIAFFEAGEKIGESSFSMKDARTAGVAGRGPWKSYPKAMLFARALSQGVRWHCPDVLGGTTAYVPEELGAQVDGEGNVIDVASRPSQPAPVERQLDVAPAPQPSPAPVPSKVGAPIPEDDEPVDVESLADQAPWEGDTLFPDAESEPGVTAAQLRAIHTRLTKLGFNGKQSEKERAREFVGFLVGRELASSKDLTKAEAMRVLDLSDDDWALRLDDFNAERQMAAEGEA